MGKVEVQTQYYEVRLKVSAAVPFIKSHDFDLNAVVTETLQRLTCHCISTAYHRPGFSFIFSTSAPVRLGALIDHVKSATAKDLRKSYAIEKGAPVWSGGYTLLARGPRPKKGE